MLRPVEEDDRTDLPGQRKHFDFLDIFVSSCHILDWGIHLRNIILTRTV